jgi:MoxR-like ATPase
MNSTNAASVRPRAVSDAVGATIVGQAEAVEFLVLALIAGGHVLLEGAPGVAKTLACRALAAAIGGTFKRVQFTPDLLPSDIVGTRVFDQRTGDFTTVRGPIFANILLADEINRAPAKVQSALLEGMQEHHATIGLETHAFPSPFTVLATMNPIDSDGTYALPLAQLDRFLAKVVVGYPSLAQETEIISRYGAHDVELRANVAGLADVLAWQNDARNVFIDDRVHDYIVALVRATRGAHYIEHGASPRAGLALAALSRARAYLQERRFVTPDDVRDLAPAVLRHRVAFDYRAAADAADTRALLDGVIASVKAP